ncbi:hypothetical protein Vretimale_16108 [Volvox reticuliferus]|nr:hypothetical protein Vretifemale_9658 [Volvox reticuliferus]GIM12885.1 hypothetical protein Vretimale_16108 [Volvox reticuliferus]
MQIDAERMKSALAACCTAARVQLQRELSMAMDAAYREAERCSQWRRRAQDYTQRCDDPGCLAAVLAATDQINQALQDWQQFTTRDVFDTLRIVVPPPPPQLCHPRQRPQARRQPLLIEPNMISENPFITSPTSKPPAQDKPVPSAVPPGWDPFAVGPPSSRQQTMQGNLDVFNPTGIELPQENGADPRVSGSYLSQIVSPTLSNDPSGRQVIPCSPSATSMTANASTPSVAGITSAGVASGTAVDSNGQRTAQWYRCGPSTTAPTTAKFPKGSEDFGDLVKAELARMPHPAPRTGPTSPAAAPGGPAATATSNSGQTSTTGSPNPTMPNGTVSSSTAATYGNGCGAAASSSSAGAYQGILPIAGTASSAPMTVAVTPVDQIQTKGSNSSGMATTTAALEWLPEFEQLESDLRALWSTCSPAPSSPSSSATVSASGTGSCASAGPGALLPEVLSRVKGMCEALAAKHARQLTTLMSVSPSAPLPFCGSLEPGVGTHGHAQLRAVASTSITSTGLTAIATRGFPGAGNGLQSETGNWVGFGVDTHKPGVGVGPLHQHLMHKQPQPQLQRPKDTALESMGKSSDGSLI